MSLKKNVAIGVTLAGLLAGFAMSIKSQQTARSRTSNTTASPLQPSSALNSSAPTLTGLREGELLIGELERSTVGRDFEEQIHQEYSYLSDLQIQSATRQTFVKFADTPFMNTENLERNVSRFFKYLNHPQVQPPRLEFVTPRSVDELEVMRSEDMLRVNAVQDTGVYVLAQVTGKDPTGTPVLAQATLREELGGSANRHYSFETRDGKITFTMNKKNVMYARPISKSNQCSTVPAEVLHDALADVTMNGIINTYLRTMENHPKKSSMTFDDYGRIFNRVCREWMVLEEGLVHALVLDWTYKHHQELGLTAEEAFSHRKWYNSGCYEKVPEFTKVLEQFTPADMLQSYASSANQQ